VTPSTLTPTTRRGVRRVRCASSVIGLHVRVFVRAFRGVHASFATRRGVKMICMGVRVLVLLSAPLESRRTNETNKLGERSARGLGRRDGERGEGMEMKITNS
jgi:hypothetical protein